MAELEYVGVRELRAGLKSILADGRPRVIGDRWHARGVVVGVAKHYGYSDREKKEALREACKALRELLDQL